MPPILPPIDGHFYQYDLAWLVREVLNNKKTIASIEQKLQNLVNEAVERSVFDQIEQVIVIPTIDTSNHPSVPNTGLIESTPSLNDCIAYAENNHIPIWLPNGVYPVNDIDFGSVSVIGSGTIKRMSGTASWSGNNIVISGITFDGNSVDNPDFVQISGDLNRIDISCIHCSVTVNGDMCDVSAYGASDLVVTGNGTNYRNIQESGTTAGNTSDIEIAAKTVKINSTNPLMYNHIPQALNGVFNSIPFQTDMGDTYNVLTSYGNYTNVYSPEQFGAAGDGTTDDSAALSAMLSQMKTDAPNIVDFSGASVSDGRGFVIVGLGKYATSVGINIAQWRGLTISNLTLIGLTGCESLITMTGTNSLIRLVNVNLECNHLANKGLTLSGNNTGNFFLGLSVRKFKEIGLNLDGDGADNKFIGCEVAQYDYDELDTVTETSGSGIYTGSNRRDTLFTAMTVGYCQDYVLELEGSFNQWSNCHFYGRTNQAKLYANDTFTNCYFDSIQVVLVDNNRFDSCIFVMTDSTHYYEYMIELASQIAYEYTKFTTCVFRSNSGGNVKAFLFNNGRTNTNTYIGTVNCAWFNVPIVRLKTSYVSGGQPWDFNIISYDNPGAAKVGELVWNYGTAHSAGTIQFVEPSFLTTPVIYGCNALDNGTCHVTTVTQNSVTIEGTSTNFNWFVIG